MIDYELKKLMEKYGDMIDLKTLGLDLWFINIYNLDFY